jgi:DNA-binding CsgD family transcriptional regulator
MFVIMNELGAGEIVEAERRLDELGDVLGLHAREGEAAMALGFSSAFIRIAKGDGAGAAEVLSQIVAALQALGLAFPTSVFIDALAVSQLLADDLDGAAASVAALSETATQLQSDHGLARAELLGALVHRRRGRPDVADPLARSALATFLRDRCGPDATEALEVLSGCLVDLGNAVEGSRLLAAAAAVRASHGWVSIMHDVIGADVDRETTRAALGDRSTSIESEGSGLTLEEAAAHSMRARGARKRPGSGWASLTPTELDVARLVTKGLSNPDIASSLVVSRATVKTHVSHVLTKLGLATRAEIAAEVTRREP